MVEQNSQLRVLVRSLAEESEQKEAELKVCCIFTTILVEVASVAYFIVGELFELESASLV